MVRYHLEVDRVLGCFASRLNWDTPTPSPAGETPPFGSGVGDPLACGRWGEGPNSDEGTLWYLS
jgi:hypothetical protein